MRPSRGARIARRTTLLPLPEDSSQAGHPTGTFTVRENGRQVQLDNTLDVAGHIHTKKSPGRLQSVLA